MSGREHGSDGETYGPLFWGGVVVGWGVIGFGLWTVAVRAGSIHPVEFGTWIVGLALVHDLVVAPIVSLVGIWLVPRLPRRWRGQIVGALLVTATLVVITIPPLLGDPAGNETILPRSYGVGLAIAIGATWIVAAIAIARAARKAR